jgi:hypothetical protein
MNEEICNFRFAIYDSVSARSESPHVATLRPDDKTFQRGQFRCLGIETPKCITVEQKGRRNMQDLVCPKTAELRNHHE